MRILHCITGLTGDGAQRLLLRLTRGLRDYSVRSVVVNLGPATPLVAEFEAVKVPVLSLGMSPSVSDIPGAISSLRRVMRDLEPDIVQGWMYHANVMTFLAKTAGRFHFPLAWNIRRGMDDYRQRSRATRAGPPRARVRTTTGFDCGPRSPRRRGGPHGRGFSGDGQPDRARQSLF